MRVETAKEIWNNLVSLYKTTDISPLIDLHHQLATADLNLQNLNSFTEKMRRIASEIKDLDGFNEDLINTL